MSKKMFLFFLTCLIVIIAATLIKQSTIRAQRRMKVISTFSEWQEKGKPVVAARAKKDTVELYTKISVVKNSENLYEAFVPRSIQVKLKPGQSFYITDSAEKFKGTVTGVAGELDINSGMFKITLSLENKGKVITEEPSIAYIRTGEIPNVICVPNSAVDRDKDQNVLWIVEDGRARKKNVVITQRNGYGSIIDKGLTEGDMVILKGITQLRENDRLHILNNEDISH